MIKPGPQQQIADARYRAEAGLATGRNDKQPQMTFRIEKRSDTGQPTEYWSHAGGKAEWMTNPKWANVYTESERTEVLNKTLRGEPVSFPSGGVWVRVEAREQEGKEA